MNKAVNPSTRPPLAVYFVFALARSHFSLLVLSLLLSFSCATEATEPIDTSRLDLTARIARSWKSIVDGPPTELGAVLALTGSDPEAITEWIGENIAFESYTGIRKGAEGVLISGSGNAADQSLLLAALFEYVGISCEMVSGFVERSELPEVLPVSPVDLNEMPPAEAIEALAHKMGADREFLYNKLESVIRTRQSFLERLWTRTLQDLETLSVAMEDAGVEVATSAPQVSKTESQRVEHWWVRTTMGVYDAILQTPLSKVEASYSVAELPEALFEKTTVQMWIQSKELEDDGSESMHDPVNVLEVTFHSAELFGKPLVVGNIPLDVEPMLDALENPTPEDVIQVFAAATQFQPQLDGPRGLLTGRPFDKSGVRLEIKDGRIDSATKMGGSMGGLFGGTFGGGQEEEKPTSQLSAVWIELKMQSGSPVENEAAPVVVRRDILQHPESKNNSLEILSMREILVHADELSSGWVTRNSLEHMAETATFTKSILEMAIEDNVTGSSLLALASDRPHFASGLYGFGMARWNEVLRLRDQIAPKAKLSKPYPMVVSMVSGFRCPDDSINVSHGLDILYQTVDVQGANPEGWAHCLPFAIGILDTALEFAMMEGSLTPGIAMRNASVELHQRLLAGGSPVVQQEGERVQLQISDPTTGARVAYYDVDLLTGMSLGMMDGGGQAMTEYAEYMAIALQLKGMLEFYGDLFKCMATGIAAPLAGGGAAQQQALAKCVFEVACGQITGVVGAFVPVDTSWTNVIAQEGINQLFGGVCKNLSGQLF